jgi:hypothetical protein
MASGYREIYKYYLMLQKGLSINSNIFCLKINNSQFEISDNSGGISEKKVCGDALKIGSSLDYKGGHGIGLKRAFLKFGKTIEITSNSIIEDL